jgi:putative tryptophan/tyrosine transport system substrate-binding protein
MDRRTFLGTLAGGLLAAPLAAEAQQAGKVWRMGSFSSVAPTTPQGEGPFYERMRELGWIHGQNFVVERRIYGDQPERIPEMVNELVRSGVDLFLVPGSIDAGRLNKVIRTIPIVTFEASDLVERGLAESLARPGGNVTGVQVLMPEVTGKHLALLKELIPSLSRVGVLREDLGSSPVVRQAKNTADALRIRLQVVAVRRAEELDAAFSTFRVGRAEGLLVLRSPFISNNERTIVDFALKHRVPAVSDGIYFARAGGLVSYGYDPREVSRLAAEGVDRILRGTQAGEIPIRQIMVFQLRINLKTAKALGLTIPPSLLQRADQVIE